MNHTKTKHIHQTDEIKEYLVTDELTTTEKKMLFKMRNRMCPNKTNSRNLHGNNLSCILCKDLKTVESETHLLECPILFSNPVVSDDIKTVEYQDIFGPISKQIKAVKLWMKIFKIHSEESTKMKTQKQ